MTRSAFVLPWLVVLSCGGRESPPSDPDGGPGDATRDASGDASRHVLACDERADCEAGNVCCAESGELTLGDANILVTSCLPSCVTGAPRFQVCRADAECESGTCVPYDCGAGMPALRYCTPPDGCTPTQ